jgi:Na+-transporting NADH:ubiquinone oxidoreductase subunit A
MALHVMKKGLDLPITGAPEQTLDLAKAVPRVALVAADYVGMKPTMFVQAGDLVKRGQPLFEDKKQPGVIHTAPGAGKVTAINRGERRAFQSIVIELNEDERRGAPKDEDFAVFQSFTGQDFATLSGEQAQALLVESGLWTALRARPYSRNAALGTRPHAIFVTAMDTEPLAPSIETMMTGREADLRAGLQVLGKLTDGPVYFCQAAGKTLGVKPEGKISVEEFDGPHPSGLAGTHIHLLDPVSREKTVWHLGLQDALAVGALFRTGKLDVTRVLSLAGPGMKRPRLLKTRIGASVDALTAGELKDGDQRVISGSVLSGRAARGDVHGYLGRYHQQISVLREGREREFLGWMSPGGNNFSMLNVFTSSLSKGKKFDFSTALNGGIRAMVPIGSYERVMPLDIMPTFLLRALLMDDVERAEQMGCLELDEEDLSLCTFVCPGKHDYGPVLRRNLDLIEREG